MKKWLIALCCVLIAAAVAFVTVVNNKNTRIDTLNKDLSDIQAEYNTLKEKSEKDEKTIQDLNQQVSDLTDEKDGLTAENGRLNETLEGLNRNLSSSQQKLQGVMYILTDGAEGKIDSILSPFMKIFQDVGTDSAYFEAVNYVNEHKLMDPLEDEVFGVSEKATLGELADSLYRLEGKTGTIGEAVSALLDTEKNWLAAQGPAEEAVEEVAEAVDEAAEETAETAEEAVEEAAAAEPEKEIAEAADTAATAEETAEAAEPEAGGEVSAAVEETEAAAEVTEEAAAETAEAAAEPEATEEISEDAEEAPAEETDKATEAPAEDETLVLTKDRILSFCNAFCGTKGIEMPEIVFPGDNETEAVRGDLAIVLLKLAQAE